MNLDSIFENNLINIWTKFDYIYSLEIKWVLKWFKKIAKFEPFRLVDLELIKDILESLNLKYVYFEKDEYFDKEKMLFLKWKSKKEQYVDIYISRSSKTLDVLKKIIETEKWNYKKNYLIWKLLWYPDCCIKSFLESNYTWDLDFNLKIKSKTIWKFDWRLNNLINPYSLIPFFPCSYNCGKAIDYAEKNLSIIWKRDLIEEKFKNIIYFKGVWDIDILKSNNMEWNNIFNFKN